MSTAVIQSDAVPQPVATELRRLRRKMNWWFVVEGLSRLCACLTLVIAADLFIDWWFNLDRAQRTVMLLLAAIPIGLVAYRYLLKPWLARLSDEAICLEVERRNPQLGESLISAVQFSRSAGPEIRQMSAEMVRATIQQGVRGAEHVVFEKILHRQRFRANALLLLVAALALAGLAASVLANPFMRTWFDRNVLLLDREWPDHTYFEFVGAVDGELTVPYGSDWPLVVRMSDQQVELPAAVDVDLQSSTGRRTQRMQRIDQDREFRLLLKRVTEPFQVRARSGRSRTDWLQIRLVQRPATESLQLELTPPRYSGLDKQRLPEGEGPYYVLKGSGLEVRGTATKPLSSATLVVGDVRHAMQLKGEKAFYIALPPQDVIPGTFGVELEDTLQLLLPGESQPRPLRSNEPTEFTLKDSPDLAPAVKAQMIGIGGMVVPKARIPFTARIEDDFGITAARLRFEWRTDSDESAGESGQSPLAQDVAGQTELTVEHVLDLADLKIPAGSGFGFEIEADDNDDVSGPKSGQSTRFLLRVVSEDELRANLLRREKELRQEFEALLTSQEEQLTETEALLAGARDKPALDVDQRKSLMEVQRREKLIESNLGSVADRLATIIIEIQNNRLEPSGGPAEQRLGAQIIQPMRALAGQDVPEVLRSLDRARRQMKQPASRDEALTLARSQQQQVIAAMREILGFMMKSEDYQEAVNLLYEVQRAQRKVADLTDREKRELLEKILKDAKNRDHGKDPGQ